MTILFYRYFKSSSPVLNTLVTLGCTMGYITGLLFLVTYYVGITGEGKLTPVCNVSIFSYRNSQVSFTIRLLCHHSGCH